MNTSILSGNARLLPNRLRCTTSTSGALQRSNCFVACGCFLHRRHRSFALSLSSFVTPPNNPADSNRGSSAPSTRHSQPQAPGGRTCPTSSAVHAPMCDPHQRRTLSCSRRTRSKTRHHHGQPRSSQTPQRTVVPMLPVHRIPCPKVLLVRQNMEIEYIRFRTQPHRDRECLGRSMR